MELEIQTARVFAPLLEPARYKGAHGGRGSGKSHFFAERAIEDCLAAPGEIGMGMRVVCIREVQKTLKESSKRLIEDKLRAFGLGEAQGFRVFNEVIEAPGDGLIAFQGMQDHNAESIKSLEGFGRAWVEEAQTLSSRSLELLKPTIRTQGSEIWFSWNPRRKTDAVDALMRGENKPTGAAVVEANWKHNPRFPKVLEQERQDCLRLKPEQYDHIWEGGYAQVLEGAYFAKDLALAKQEGRVSRVAADPLMTYRAFVDIGGTGAKADAFAMWIVQFVGREIRVLDYYEVVGQPLASHINWLRFKGYDSTKTHIWLPHDGATNDRVHDVSFESAFRQAGYTTNVVPNQGRGAAKNRIEAARRMFPSCWFNKDTTQPGLDALGWYHEKKDEARNIGLGPEHDWASHGADAWGLCCVVAELPSPQAPKMDLHSYKMRRVFA